MNKQKIERILNIMKGNLLFNLIIQIFTFAFSIFNLISTISNINNYYRLKDPGYRKLFITLDIILIIFTGLILAILLYAIINTIKRNPEKIFSIKIASFILIFTPISYNIKIFVLGTENIIILIIVNTIGLVIGIYSLIFMFRPKSEEIKSFYLKKNREN